MGEKTELYKIQTEKWAALSLTVQSTVAVVATSWISFAEAPADGSSAALVAAIVATVGGALTILGRIRATGGLSLRAPPKDQIVSVEIDHELRKTGRVRETRHKMERQP